VSDGTRQPHRTRPPRPAAGFTLIELGLVLILLALLGGGLLLPISGAADALARRQAQAGLADIRAALLAYAALHGHLPCPDPSLTSDDAAYGLAAGRCPGVTAGFLPFRSLGLAELDPWGERWRYRVDGRFADADAPIGFDSAFSSPPLVVLDGRGRPLVTAIEPPLAIFYSTGANRHADALNAEAAAERCTSSTPAPDFDDLVQWFARPLLFNTLIAAGRL
jgi:type II secretory pathway pseudopilin PulG